MEHGLNDRTVSWHIDLETPRDGPTLAGQAARTELIIRALGSYFVSPMPFSSSEEISIRFCAAAWSSIGFSVDPVFQSSRARSPHEEDILIDPAKKHVGVESDYPYVDLEIPGSQDHIRRYRKATTSAERDAIWQENQQAMKEIALQAERIIREYNRLDPHAKKIPLELRSTDFAGQPLSDHRFNSGLITCLRVAPCGIDRIISTRNTVRGQLNLFFSTIVNFHRFMKPAENILDSDETPELYQALTRCAHYILRVRLPESKNLDPQNQDDLFILSQEKFLVRAKKFGQKILRHLRGIINFFLLPGDPGGAQTLTQAINGYEFSVGRAPSGLEALLLDGSFPNRTIKRADGSSVEVGVAPFSTIRTKKSLMQASEALTRPDLLRARQLCDRNGCAAQSTQMAR